MFILRLVSQCPKDCKILSRRFLILQNDLRLLLQQPIRAKKCLQQQSIKKASMLVELRLICPICCHVFLLMHAIIRIFLHNDLIHINDTSTVKDA